MITLVAPICIGWLADVYLHTEPWGLIIGVISGFIAVIMLLINITKNI